MGSMAGMGGTSTWWCAFNLMDIDVITDIIAVISLLANLLARIVPFSAHERRMSNQHIMINTVIKIKYTDTKQIGRAHV